ncbi:MAG TPA: tetratricopeptide repeat protein [Ktedonobacteraceae bacterium]|nr:tetratricopeptide repeat protein [Ktedonobacteraceae bacterium]
MGNMGSAGNFGGVGHSGPAPTMAGAGGGMGTAPRKRITASQVTGVLKQAQTFQAQGRFPDAIDLCEQILESGFDRPDARYFLGWLYQEQQRWDEAIRQFQMLLNDPDYALSCYYALGQCHRARGDLRTATMHFDEAVDRVNLDALTVEESDQLVQLCQEAAEAHRLLGEMDQALTVYNALLGFLRSRGWSDKVAQVEFMLQQARNAPMPSRPITPPVGVSRVEQMATQQQPSVLSSPQQSEQTQRPAPTQPGVADAATMAFNMGAMPNGQSIPPMPPASPMPTQQPQALVPPTNSSVGELPDWLTGILSDADKKQVVNRSSTPPPAPPTTKAAAPQAPQPPQPGYPVPGNNTVAETTMRKPAPANPDASGNPPMQAAAPTWLTDVAPPAPAPAPQPPAASAPTAQPPTKEPPAPAPMPAPQPPMAASPDSGPPPDFLAAEATVQAPKSGTAPTQPQPESIAQASSQAPVQTPPAPAVPSPAPVVPPPLVVASPPPAVSPAPVVPPPAPVAPPPPVPLSAAPAKPAAEGPGRQNLEDLLNQMAGTSTKDEALKQVAEAVLASTASLPENIRLQVVRSMQDIQKYINHGLLTSATEECLKVIDLAPQYLDVHQVLCEIYVRQNKIEQAITKYAILVDTYIVNGRTEDAIATYRRILQLEPNNLTYRLRLINLLSSQGNKEDLVRERTLAAESYLRLGYMDRAVTELEQALQENPTSVPTRLNYALALQKLGRLQQAVAEYQRVLQVDPGNLTALVRWHVAMITNAGAARATTLEVLTRIRWQLRGEGQKHYEAVIHEYTNAADAYPENADVFFALGQLHQQAGQYDQALDTYTKAMRDSALEVLARTGAAHCLLFQGKPEAAIQQLEQALQHVRRAPASLDPGIWAARPREEGEEHQAPEVELSLLLAKAYERTGRREQMLAILRQIKQSKPSAGEVASTLADISARQSDIKSILNEYYELVRHYRSNRQVENALTVLNEMVRIEPQDIRPHDELADIYISRGLLEEGIAELRLMADIYLRRNQLEEAGRAIQQVGTIYADIGNNEEALSNLRRAAELRPEDMGLLREVVGFSLRLARQVERKDEQEASRYLEIAAQYQSIIARHYFETHQVKEAVAAIQQLITIDKSNLEAYDMLGQTYQNVGEYEQASRVYRNLAKVHPDSSLARERLATLQELRTK